MVRSLERSRSGRRGRDLHVTRPGLHEEAVIRLRELIMRGELKPGEQLNETELSEALGLSRTPLREALKLLAMEGLVDLRRNRSAVVTTLRSDEISSLFEAVAGIERMAAELAALRMTTRELQKLRSLHGRMERYHEKGDLIAYFDINNEIHSFIVACAKNAPLKSCHDTLLARVKRARFLALTAFGRRDESVREHRDFLKAFETRDGEAAGRILSHHVLGTGQTVNQSLQEPDNVNGESYVRAARRGR